MRKSVIELKKSAFKRVLGVSDLFAIGYGDLGSSIYYALGITALYALGATPLALGIAGLVFICTALTYAEMSSAFHESGGSASYARHAFNDFISFIAGWGLLLDYIVTIAISAFAVGPYLAYFFPDLKLVSVQIGFTIAIILILIVINAFGIRQSTKMSFVLSGFTIIIQAAIVLIGLIFLFNFSYLIDHIRIGVAGASWSPSWPEFWKGTAMAMVAYTGIESIVQLGAEAKTPSRTVPKAIFITMCMLVVMYIGISTVALSAIDPHKLGTDWVNDPLAGIVANFPFAAAFLKPWVGIMGAAVLIVAANAGLIGSSRLSFNMGEYYQLPKFFHRLLPPFRTPVVALLFFGILACFIVIASRGKLDFIADLYNFGAMIAFFFAHLALIALRIKQPHLKRPFKVPLNIPFGKFSLPLTAIIGCIATASVWLLVVITKKEGRYLGLAWMAFGIIMYIIYRRNKKLASMGRLSIERVKIPEFKAFDVHKILVITKDGANIEALQVACEIAKTHRAEVSGLHIMEIPPSMPLDAKLPHRTALAEAALKKGEAISRDMNIKASFEMMRTRSFSAAALSLVKEGKFDLLILGVDVTDKRQKDSSGFNFDTIIRNAPCRVWICKKG